MKNLVRAFLVGGTGLMLSCAAVGCKADDKDKDLVFLGLGPNNQVGLAQGESTGVGVRQGTADAIEGEKDGVKAVIDEEGRLIRIAAADNARVGTVKLTVKNKAGKPATLTVTVRKAVFNPVGHELLLDSDKLDVKQGKEVAVKIKHGWAGSVSDPKDGLSAKVDGKWIKLTATSEAKLGVQELTVKGAPDTAYETLTVELTVTVKAAASK
jgi:hypothetical protein